VRTNVKMLIAMTVSSLGLLGFTAAPALANVAGPLCSLGGSQVECDALGSPGTTTWTITATQEGVSNTYSYTTSVNNTHFGCERGQFFKISFSYVSGGVTVQSNITPAPCETGPQE
jgi:hypothetical protein